MNENLVLELHHIGAIQFGKFKLKSGALAPFYLDLRILVSHPREMRTVARTLAQILSPLKFDRIAAIPLAALPIGTAVALEMDRPLIYPRPLKKSYANERIIEGEFHPNETVVVLDDIIMAGASKLEAIETLQSARLKVRDVVVIVDREQGGAAQLAKRNIGFHPVMTIRQMTRILCDAKRISESQFAEVMQLLENA